MKSRLSAVSFFDSNLGQCLTLSKASLDWCYNCNGGFSKVHKVVQFRKKVSQT
jgi:hypothetical protein